MESSCPLLSAELEFFQKGAGMLGVTITVRTPALCLLDTSDKSFSLCLPYPSFTLCLIHTDNFTSLSIPFLVRYLCSTYDSFLITNTVVSLVHQYVRSLVLTCILYKPMYLDV